MRWRRLAPLAATVVLLAGCATTVPRKPNPAAAPPTMPAPAATLAPAVPPPQPVAGRPAFWTQLRSRLRMDDCGPDPRIEQWARRFTHAPGLFQAQLRHDLPLIAYIAGVAQRYDVPAEFVFLPWVESRYRPIAPRRGHAAGMWQIMPATARTMHLPVSAGYDARMDRIAATAAVMRLLAGYHDTFHDWRLVDMAFNAGKYRMLDAVHGRPVPEMPPVPQLGVPRGTRQHLVKLLAMACVVDDPQRFGVTLPRLTPGSRLREVAVSTPINMHAVARLAAMSVQQVRELNPAYRQGRMPPGAPRHVLLPATHAASFDSAFAAAAGTLADANRPNRLPPPQRYVVSAGDNLWSIAQRFGTSVHRLKHLNHLDSAELHPGQVLRLGPLYR